MKKFLALILAAVMCLSLAACAKSPSSPDDSGSGTDDKTANSDLQYVKDKGKLVVGITNFAPMDYQDSNGNWIGFDADMAKLFAESLGVKAEFVEITWKYKSTELAAKNIDCVWNGMTLDDEVKAAMSTSNPYCLNAQVLVVPADKAEQFTNLENLNGLNVAVEAGSAGEKAATALGATVIPLQDQANTLMEVSAGTADAAVIDRLMASVMIGEGTNYTSLTYTVNLNSMQNLPSEEYGVGFRKGSDLTEAFNKFWAEKLADGTVVETAKTYKLADSLVGA